MKVAICEDQSEQIDLLNNKIKKWAKDKDINISIDDFTSAESFLFQWLDYDKYDVVFLDINMSKMSGIELSNIIREKNKTIDIVFVTGFFKYALHGYRVGALQYLMKPINTLDLYSCLDKVLYRTNGKDETSKLIVETTKKVIKLDYNEIYYCIMFSPYIDVHTKSEKNSTKKENKRNGENFT
ncbi:LytR/AlgR family response regulator transcription factor [Paraclostridium bifermentans]|uniref:LytR/AlgR family response regulator transcription factor n=1 Tax=Paraclostridium bifermentans TaxID=1490 RepID=UPI00359C1348